MKVLIDIDRALVEGHITADERDKLKRLSRGQTSDLALNILIAFGIVAVTAGFVALTRSYESMYVPGCALAALGLALVLRGGERWHLLAQITLVVGTALFGAWMIVAHGATPRVMIAATIIFAGASVMALNGLLAAAAVLTLSSALGAATKYIHARYFLAVEAPAMTILVCGIVAVGLVAASRRVPTRYERIALIAARTSTLLVNLAFLVGSLWGDRFGGVRISRDAFSVAWAMALLAAAIWAWRENRRWPLIAATVFAALHFYTQLFERLGPHAIAIVIAGALSIAIGYGLKLLLAAMPKPA